MKTALTLYRIYRHCNKPMVAILLTIQTLRKTR